MSRNGPRRRSSSAAPHGLPPRRRREARAAGQARGEAAPAVSQGVVSSYVYDYAHRCVSVGRHRRPASGPDTLPGPLPPARLFSLLEVGPRRVLVERELSAPTDAPPRGNRGG